MMMVMMMEQCLSSELVKGVDVLKSDGFGIHRIYEGLSTRMLLEVNDYDD